MSTFFALQNTRFRTTACNNILIFTASNPSTFMSLKPRTKTKLNYKGLLLIPLLVLFVYCFPYTKHKPTYNYPPPHPYTSKSIILSNSKYIYPEIQHASLLNEFGLKNLVVEQRVRDSFSPDIEKILLTSLDENDSPDGLGGEVKTKFANLDKRVYNHRKGKYPEIIIVTLIDFQKYSFEALVKIVQNRVDFAHANSYGVYVRWYQEFLPHLNSFTSLSSPEKRKWVRLYCLQAAMFAFPEASWFYFIDEDALIMEFDNLQKKLLNNLDAVSMETSIIPPSGLIKTSPQVDDPKLIISQSKSKIETNTLLIKNDPIGRAILSIWGDILYSNYVNFPNGPDSALTHILQWHPYILSKTVIVPGRLIGSKHYELENSDPNGYQEGDFVVQWSDCKGVKCEQALNHYAAKSLAKLKKD